MMIATFTIRVGGSRAALAVCAVALLASVLTGGEARADSGTVIGLPQAPAKPKNGLRLNIDTRWVDGNGYRPVRVTALNWPPGPTPADRSFRVVLRPQSWTWGQESLSVTQYLEMPQGSASATATILVPQSHNWGSLQVEIFEGGMLLKDLSQPVGLAMRGGNTWTEAAPAILILDADAPPRDQRQSLVARLRSQRSSGPPAPRTLPDVRGLVHLFPESGYNSGIVYGGGPQVTADDDVLFDVSNLSKVDLQTPGELPESWLGLSCFDLAFVSWADLQNLARSRPAALQALRQWLGAGQTLCAYDMPLDERRLAELEKLLDIPAETGDGEGGLRAGWAAPSPRTARADIQQYNPTRGQTVTRSVGQYQVTTHPDGSMMVNGPNGSQWIAAGQPLPAEVAAALTPALPAGAIDQRPAETPFVLRPVEFGRLVAIRSAEPFLPGKYGLPWMLNEVRAENWKWHQRHGLSLNRQNADYWNFAIPGVGRAPVGSYLVLITLFVILIGPVNYYWLNRKRRLYLLLVTVPAGAGLVTFALFNYALLTDGLAVRVRVRSFTHLDQRSGRMASWSRQTYYAGLAPSGGLSFPAEAACYPIAMNAQTEDRRRSDRRLMWDDQQRLRGGYLTSRSSSQFMVAWAGRGSQGLDLSEAGGAAPGVRNRLGSLIERLVVRDSAGRYFLGASLEPGGQATLEPADAATAAGILKRLFNDNRLAFPPGYDPQYYNNSFAFRPRYYGWSDVDQQEPPPKFELGLLERSLDRALFQGAGQLPPRSYVAVLRTSPEVPIGYRAAREEAGFHVLQGRW